jgi:hypothetical protein
VDEEFGTSRDVGVFPAELAELRKPCILTTVPLPLLNKTTFMLCMKHLPLLRGRYIPTDVFNTIFTFLRSDVDRYIVTNAATTTSTTTSSSSASTGMNNL